MKLEKYIPSPIRLRVAGLTAFAGGIVSVAMVLCGGPMARFLPVGEGFHLAAIVGAGAAGVICAGGFGRQGRRGWVIASLAAVLATLAGAIIGSTLMGLLGGTMMAYGLGIIAVLDASSSVAAVSIWAVTMAGLHYSAGQIRRRS